MAKAAKGGDLETRPFPSREAWEAWLAQNGATSPGIWVKFAKKSSGIASITYDEAVEAALCHGWIDGQKASFDESYYLLRFTRRGPKSVWSKINRAKAARLIEEGCMTPAGLREVDAAKADGRWDRAYDSARTMEIPEDFRAKLDEAPAARAAFEAIDGANRYAILYRLHDAKKPETRSARIEKFVAMLARGEMIHPARAARPRKGRGEVG